MWDWFSSLAFENVLQTWWRSFHVQLWENTMKINRIPAYEASMMIMSCVPQFGLTHQSLFKSHPHIDFHILFYLLYRNRHICEFHWLFPTKTSIVDALVCWKTASNVKFIIFETVIFIGRLFPQNKAMMLLFFYIRCCKNPRKIMERLCHVWTIGRDRFTLTFQESCQGMFFFSYKFQTRVWESSECLKIQRRLFSCPFRFRKARVRFFNCVSFQILWMKTE